MKNRGHLVFSSSSPNSSVMSVLLFVRVKVSDRVERRLQEIEREMRTERELVERRQDQLGLISLQLQEVCEKYLLRMFVLSLGNC